MEEQLKPLSVKLTVRVNIDKYKEALARTYNVKPEDIEVIIEDSKSKTATPLIAPFKDEPKPNRWLQAFLKTTKLERKDAAELCGVSLATIGRAVAGYRIENPTFDKIVEGLGLTAEQATEFRNSLCRKQVGYTK